jgi:hypothetical protein
LQDFERLAANLKDDGPPSIRVAPQVMRRVRAAEVSSQRTLALLAGVSCAVAMVVTAVGVSLLMQVTDPLEALFEIVPPIGL